MAIDEAINRRFSYTIESFLLISIPGHGFCIILTAKNKIPSSQEKQLTSQLNLANIFS